MRQPLLFALTATLVAACGLPGSHELPDPLEPGPPSADPASEAPAPVEPLQCQQGISAASCDCSELHCGNNGAIIDGIAFSKLHSGGQANAQGLAIAGYAVNETAAKSHTYFTPGDVVIDNRLTLFEGQYIVLKREAQYYFVKIEAMDQTSGGEKQYYWAHDAAATLPWYRLTYTTPQLIAQTPPGARVPYFDVCEQDPLEQGWASTAALIFEGNIYDQLALTVAASPRLPANQTWFNVACFGSLPAKMLAIRRVDLFATPLTEQQAFVNMWSGNYCGDGESFTRAGWKLGIRDRYAPGTTGAIEWTHPASFENNEIASIDAVWNENGAVCIDTPRLQTDLVKAGKLPVGVRDWREAIELRCGRTIPRCTKTKGVFPAGWPALGYVISVNPT